MKPKLGDRICFLRDDSDLKSTGTVVAIIDTLWPSNSWFNVIVDDFDCIAYRVKIYN